MEMPLTRGLFDFCKIFTLVEKLTPKRGREKIRCECSSRAAFKLCRWILRSYFSSTKSTSKGSSVKFSGRWLPPANHIVWPALKRFSSVLPSGSVKREC